MLFPAVQRYLPRSGPSTGPTSRRDRALQAEVTHLTVQLARLEKEQQIQFRRIADIQQEIDEIKRLLKKIAGA
jgi:uncharacterized sporulation protein YeaH/YhbH (DUF444 family)